MRYLTPVRVSARILAVLATLTAPTLAQAPRSGNPILPGWYADPEAHVFDGQYWIFPTYSAPYDQQTFLDAFSSRDLITWVKHPHVLDVADVSWAKRAVWAPSIVEKDGWYYLFFGANDIQNDQQVGGIGVARSRSPEGPFKDYLGKPLIDRFHNGAQPIDQMVFKDRDGSYYIVYGGWRHCNIAKLNADFTGFVPFPDGSTFKEITPAGYVEGAFMLIKDGKYYFMWSEGGWTGPNYAVAYAVGSSPFGPFERVGKILQQDSTVATGAGHHSVLQSPSGKWYIVYHRRPLGETDRNHRVVSIDELRFDERGMIQPVRITKEGRRRGSDWPAIALSRDSELTSGREPVDHLPVPGDSPVGEVVHRHPLNLDRSPGAWVPRNRARLVPAHGPRDRHTIALGDGLAEVEAKVGKRSARRDQTLLELVARQRPPVPRVSGVAVDDVAVAEEFINGCHVSLVPHRFHEFRENASVVGHLVSSSSSEGASNRDHHFSSCSRVT